MEYSIGKMVLSFISNFAGKIFHYPGQRQDVNVGVARLPQERVASVFFLEESVRLKLGLDGF